MTTNIMTLAELMTAVRSRADMLPAGYTPTLTGNTGLFVNDAELITYIGLSAYELYDLMISAYGEDYFIALPPPTFLTDGSTQTYPLPVDFYKLKGVDLNLSPNDPSSFVTIRPFNFSERNRYSVPNFQSFYGVTNLRYRLTAGYINMIPIPSGGQTIKLWYIPRLAPLALLTDTFDGISGWTEYVVVDAAIKCLVKEESDTAALERAKAALVQRIRSMATDRDAGSPATVSDVSIGMDGWAGGGGADGWGH